MQTTGSESSYRENANLPRNQLCKQPKCLESLSKLSSPSRIAGLNDSYHDGNWKPSVKHFANKLQNINMHNYGGILLGVVQNYRQFHKQTTGFVMDYTLL